MGWYKSYKSPFPHFENSNPEPTPFLTTVEIKSCQVQIEYFLEDDMQSRRYLPPSSEVAKLSFRSQKMCNSLICMQKQFSDFSGIF